MLQKPVDNTIAMTGELSIRGDVKPVGGVAQKIEAALQAGIKKVIIPEENWQESFRDIDIEIIKAVCIEQVIKYAITESKQLLNRVPQREIEYLSASACE